MGNQKLVFVSASVIAAVLIGLFVIPGPLKSYSLNDATDFAEKMSSSSGYTTITVDGQATKQIQPDQISLLVSVTNPSIDLESAFVQKSTSQESFANAIKNAANNDPQVQIIPKASNLNPSQYAQTNLNGMYSAYLSIPAKIKTESFAAFSKEVADLGFRIDYVNVVPISKESENDSTEGIISIPSGSATPDCANTDTCYIPKEIKVGVGSVLLWQNDDSASHTITSGTSSDGPNSVFDSGLITSGKSFSYEFTAEGTYQYFCLVHPWMIGSIIVSSDAKKIVAETPVLTDQFELSASLTLQTKTDTLDNTMQEYKQKSAQLTNILAKYGIEEKSKQIQNISINPVYYGQGKPTSFSSYSNFLINTTPDHLENIIDAVTAQKGNIDNIYMSNSDSLLDSTRKELTQLALDDAKNRVTEMIEPMGLQIKSVKSVKVNQAPQFNQYGNPMVYSRGVVWSMDYQQSADAGINVSVEFEVGK